MGGRGTFAVGKPAEYTYKTIEEIDGVKILQPINTQNGLKLPEESHSSFAYILLDRDNVFHQYREYNAEHEIILEIGYHHERTLGKGDILHIHIFQKPGILYHNDSTTTKRKLTREEYEKYKKYFKGVTIDEGKYFSSIYE